MILDTVENMSLYFDRLPGFERVEKAYKEYAANPFENGKITVEENVLWCNVSTYGTKKDSPLKYESHRKYADVQLMFEGEEMIGWAPFKECSITEDFTPDGDIAFMTHGDNLPVVLKKGYFAVFFPEDAHAPCQQSGDCKKVTKLVFKVKL